MMSLIPLVLGLLALEGCAPDAPESVGFAAVKAPPGEYCDGEDNDGDGVVDEDCGQCDMLYTRVKSWWIDAGCVVEGQGTGHKLTPIRVGSTNTYATPDTLASFLASPGNTDKQRLGQQILVGKLNSRAFGIGDLPYHDWDGDGALETVDELLALADGVFDAPDTTAQVNMFVLLGQLNAEGTSLPVYIDQNCARDAEYCDGLDNDGDGVVDDACGCVEACDGLDNNGDGTADEEGPDNDNDGYMCDDCDDGRNRTNPAAYDVPENAIDDDCDGADATSTYDFDLDVQPLFDTYCTGCHSAADPQGGLDLSSGAYERIVNVRSTQATSYDLVEPASPTQSYLYRKVVGTHTSLGGTGGRMPLGGPYLSLSQAALLATWITEGAAPSCPDADGDGWDCTDCNDADATVYPGAPEIRGDEIDQDCDDADDLYTYGLNQDIQALYDAACVSCHGATTAALGLRLDAGMSTAATVGIPATQLPTMSLVEPGDHTRSYMYHKVAGTHVSVGGSGNRMPRGGVAWLPEVLEVYAAWIDEGAPADACDDADGDVYSCSDCNDADASVSPAAVEVCDGVDNNCDGVVDDDAADGATWFADADADGFGDSAEALVACTAPAGFVADASDCDDTNPSTHPGATEECDGADDDCDGTVDEGWTTTWYVDADGDGYGTTAATASGCAAPSGYVANDDDCDDTRSATNPGAAEVCTLSASSCSADGRDDDCDGTADDGCGTLRQGTIGSPTTWSGENLVCSDVTVSSAGSLTISDNAVVRVRAGKKITVQGALDVLGTDAAGESFVHFQPEEATAGPGGWNYVVVSGASARATITGARFDRAQYGLYVNSGATVEVHDSEIVDASSYGLYLSASTVWVEGSTVTGTGSYGVYQYAGTLDLETTVVSETAGEGIRLQSGAVADLVDVTVTTTGADGVYVSSSTATATGLVVTDAAPASTSADGIYVTSGTFTGTDVVVDTVGGDGVYASSGTVRLTDSSVANTGDDGVYCTGSTGSASLTRVAVTGAGGDGIYRNGDGGLSVSGSTVTGSAGYPVLLTSAENLGNLDGTNAFTGNGTDVIPVTSDGTVNTTMTWLDPGVPVLDQTTSSYPFKVNGGATLTLGAGFTLDLDGGTVTVGSSSGSTGSLVLLGTEAAPVTLLDGGLSLAYVPGPVALGNLVVTPLGTSGLSVGGTVTSPVTLTDVRIEGGSGTSAVLFDGVDLTMERVTVEDGTYSSRPLYLDGANVSLTDVAVNGVVTTGAESVVYLSVTTAATLSGVELVGSRSTATTMDTTGLYVDGDGSTTFTLTDVLVDGAAGRGVFFDAGTFTVSGLVVTGTTFSATAYPGYGLGVSSSVTWAGATGFALTGNASYGVLAADWSAAAGLDPAGLYVGNGEDEIRVSTPTMDSGATLTLTDLGVPYVSSAGMSVTGTVHLDGCHVTALSVVIGSGATSTSPRAVSCTDCVIEAYTPGAMYGVSVAGSNYNSFTMTGGEVFGFDQGVHIGMSSGGTPTVQMSGYTIHDNSGYGLWCDNGCTYYEATSGNSVTGGAFYNNGTDIYY